MLTASGLVRRLAAIARGLAGDERRLWQISNRLAGRRLGSRKLPRQAPAETGFCLGVRAAPTLPLGVSVSGTPATLMRGSYDEAAMGSSLGTLGEHVPIDTEPPRFAGFYWRRGRRPNDSAPWACKRRASAGLWLLLTELEMGRG